MQSTKQTRKPTAKKEVQSTKQTSEVAVIQKNTLLSLADPSQVMEFGKVLKKYIADNGLSVNIQGSEYAMVDGWKFAGLNFGLTAIPRKPVKVHEKGQYITVLKSFKEFEKKDKSKYTKEVTVFIGYSDDVDAIEQARKSHVISGDMTKPYFAYECECDIKRLSDGTVIGYGEGFCSNLESLKSGFDEYSVNSQSQTRSIGKAYRNLLGYVMKSAGFESTPAEEMEQVSENEKQEKKEKSKPGLVKPTQVQFEKIKSRIALGELTVEEALKHFVYTDNLIEEMRSIHVTAQVVKEVGDDTYKLLMTQLISGKTTLTEIEREYVLSESQRKALEVIKPAKK